MDLLGLSLRAYLTFNEFWSVTNHKRYRLHLGLDKSLRGGWAYPPISPTFQMGYESLVPLNTQSIVWNRWSPYYFIGPFLRLREAIIFTNAIVFWSRRCWLQGWVKPTPPWPWFLWEPTRAGQSLSRFCPVDTASSITSDKASPSGPSGGSSCSYSKQFTTLKQI